MKTTIKLTALRSVTISPSTLGGVMVGIVQSNPERTAVTSEFVHLTEDQCGALLFGVENALEVTAQGIRHYSPSPDERAAVGRIAA